MAKRIYRYILIVELITLVAVMITTLYWLDLCRRGIVQKLAIREFSQMVSADLGFQKESVGFIENMDLSANAEIRGKIDKNSNGIGVATVYNGKNIIFQSDPAWDVKEIIAGDFNNDGKNDFALSLWKKGTYGQAKPFWVSRNDDSYRMHLFVYSFENGKVVPIWHSSNLPKENLRTRLADVNNDKQNELVVIEKGYEGTPDENNWSLGLWKWDDWGFSLQERRELLL